MIMLVVYRTILYKATIYQLEQNPPLGINGGCAAGDTLVRSRYLGCS